MAIIMIANNNPSWDQEDIKMGSDLCKDLHRPKTDQRYVFGEIRKLWRFRASAEKFVRARN